MEENIPETLSPEECASKIFELSGVKFEPDVALDLWGKILQHKWLLSEKVGRDVGFRTACIDFLENMEQAVVEYSAYKQRDILKEMGAQTIGRELWDTISDSQPPKQLVQRRIILPLDQGRPFQKTRCDSSKDHHFFRTSGHGKDSFRQGHSRSPFMVVYRNFPQYAHGGRRG